MELKDYIKEALKEIMRGVSEAQDDLKGSDLGIVNPMVDINMRTGGSRKSGGDPPLRVMVQTVEISAVVTLEERQSDGTKVGFNVSMFGASRENKGGESNSTVVNAIKFSVPVAFRPNPE